MRFLYDEGCSNISIKAAGLTISNFVEVHAFYDNNWHHISTHKVPKDTLQEVFVPLSINQPVAIGF